MNSSSKVAFLVLAILISVVVGLVIFKLPLAQTAESPAKGQQVTTGQGDCVPMTNAAFANAIILALGIEMPEGTGNLSEAELFEVQANILAERGIDYFKDSGGKAVVAKGELCNVFQILNETVVQATNTSSGRSNVTNPFYDPISGYAKTPPSETGSYEEQFGCATGTGDNDSVCTKDVIAALSNPEYALLVAEAYSHPRGRGRPGPALIVPPLYPIPEEYPELREEKTASRITCN
ncbi:hypothetical protein ACFL2Y_00810 [Candidatus Omnitrophota bacterium]